MNDIATQSWVLARSKDYLESTINAPDRYQAKKNEKIYMDASNINPIRTVLLSSSKFAINEIHDSIDAALLHRDVVTNG